MDMTQTITKSNISTWQFYEWDTMELEFKKSLLDIFKKIEHRAYSSKDFETIYEIRSWIKSKGIAVYWNSDGDVTNIKAHIPFSDLYRYNK